LAGPCIIIQFKQINQPDATASQVYYLMFMCRSTCFGRLHAQHQELTTALTASDFTLERGGSSVVGRGLQTCEIVAFGWLICLNSDIQFGVVLKRGHSWFLVHRYQFIIHS
jgi:hypothetical protein